MYWIGIVAFTAPSRCPDGPTSPQQYVAIYLQLAVYIFWLGLTALMLWVSLRGAPFELSKRWLLPALAYTYVLSWLPAAGILAYSVYVIYGVEDTCWASDSHSMIALMTFGAMGIMAGIVFTIVTTYPLFGEVRPEVKWHAVKKGVSTCVGCYGWLFQKFRGPIPQLEELATEYLDRHGHNALDLDKSDVVAALMCARLVQRERRQAIMRARLVAAGQLPGSTSTAGTAAGAGEEGGGGVTAMEMQWRQHTQQPLSQKQQRQPLSQEQQQEPRQGDAAGQANEKGVGPGSLEHEGQGLLEWIQSVCQGSRVCLTPSSMALHLAPHLSVKEAAAICTDAEGPTSEEDLREALHWARYAAAAYGQLGYVWAADGQSAGASRRRLAQLAKQAQQGGKLPAPVQRSSKLALDWVAVQELLCPGADVEILHLSPANEAEGRLAYFIALDRARQCVVLSVSGQQRYARMAQDPVELPSSYHLSPQEGGEAASHIVHAGALAAAEALAGDVELHGILSSFLPAAEAGSTAAPTAAPEVQSTAAGGPHPAGAAAAGGAAPVPATTSATVTAPPASVEVAPTAVGSSSDGTAGCPNGEESGSAWALVLTGHGQGAGAAVLLGLQLSQRYAAKPKVWAFEPPGGLCDGPLAKALAPRVVTGILGKDAVPRTTGHTVAALVQEGLVGLARLRYNKSLMMVALLAEKTGPRSWRGRWLNPARALHPPDKIPPEPLRYLERFYQQQSNEEPSAAGRVCLPGRVLYLRRLKPLPHPPTSQQQQQRQRQQGAAGEGGEGAATAAAAGRMEAGQAARPAEQLNGTPHQHQQQEQQEQQQQGPEEELFCGGCCGGFGRSVHTSRKQWDAVWVSPEAVAGEGILVSKRGMHDHYVSRLMSVLGRSVRGTA